MEQIDKLKERIPYDADRFGSTTIYTSVLNALLEDSKFKCLSILYPFEDYSDYDIPTKHLNWQIRASVELYNLADKSGIVSYSENGISFAKLTDGLSLSLINELTPKVGIPIPVEEVVEDV